MTIKIDGRTGSVDLLPFLIGSAEIAALDFGDASFMGKGPGNMPVLVGIERKRVDDLIQSTTTGRFQGHQLPGLVSSYGYVYLIVEGAVNRSGDLLQYWQGKDCRDAGFTVRQFDNLLNTLAVIAGIIVITTRDDRETAIAVKNLYHWWQKDWDEHKGHVGFYVEPHPVAVMKKPSLLRRIAKELPGVGWDRSRAIEAAFPCVKDMVNAAEHKWKQIPGIGGTLAARIIGALKGGK